jgi:hypothetical protein
MTKKKIVLFIAFILLLGGVSYYFNRDRFATEPLEISHRSMAPRGWMSRGPAAKNPANPVVFLLNRTVKLTSVKVILATDAETNKFPHAIWDLDTTSNSVPVKEFMYGAPIHGMKPAVKGATADPLEPGVNYRLLVVAGAEKAQHDFTPVPRMQ